MFNNSPFGSAASFLTLLLRSHYLGAASLTFFGYDILLTFDDEVRYIFQGSLSSLPKILYLSNRYYTLTVLVINTLTLLLPNPSRSFCVFGTRWSSVGGLLTKFILDLWLVLRVYAMWNRDGRVLAAMLIVFIGNVAFSTTTLGIVTGKFVISSTPPRSRLPGATGCAVSGPEGDFWLTFVTSLVFEVIIVSFTIAKAVMHSRAGFSRRDTPLATHLYKTGMLYFLLVGTVMAFMSITALTPLNGIILPAQFLCAIISSVGTRMMLSIRKVLQGDDQLSDLRPSDMYLHFQTSEYVASTEASHPAARHSQEHEMSPMPPTSASTSQPPSPLKPESILQPPLLPNRMDHFGLLC